MTVPKSHAQTMYAKTIWTSMTPRLIPIGNAIQAAASMSGLPNSNTRQYGSASIPTAP